MTSNTSTSVKNIPDELLFYMCSSWDTPTLLNMSKAYSRVYQVCEKVREQRKELQSKIRNILPPDAKSIYHIIKSSDGQISLYGSRNNEFLFDILNFQAGLLSDVIFIPRIRSYGNRETIKEYLLRRSFTNGEANEIINTGITQQNYPQREQEFIKTFGI